MRSMKAVMKMTMIMTRRGETKKKATRKKRRHKTTGN